MRSASEPRPTLAGASVLEAARAGDQDAFAELTGPFRRELHLHCYRMLGSFTEADDLVQDTMMAAWRGLPSFAARSSLRTWLYRIATNRCLNAIRDSKRRPPPVPVAPFDPPEPSRRGDVTWLQPYPDAWLGQAADASGRQDAHDTVRLAFIAALQRLAPRQLAAVVLCDVLDFSPVEVAAMLETTPTAVKGLRQRARASLTPERCPRPGPAPGSPAEMELARRFADAYSADDVAGVVALLTEDAWLAMPPAPHEYQGTAAIAGFLAASAAGRGGRRFRLVPTRANGQPAFTCYLDADRPPRIRTIRPGRPDPRRRADRGCHPVPGPGADSDLRSLRASAGPVAVTAR